MARGWYYLGGQNGIPSIPQMTLGSYTFDEGPVYYYMAFATLILVYVSCRFLVRSQFGLALAGIREQEARISFFGYKVQLIKTIIFSLAGSIAGLAGGLYAFHEGFVWPNMLGVILSTQVVLYTLFGGVGTLIGAVIGVIGIEVSELRLSRQLPGDLADHPRCFAASRDLASADRAHQPRRTGARTDRQFRAASETPCRRTLGH